MRLESRDQIYIWSLVLYYIFCGYVVYNNLLDRIRTYVRLYTIKVVGEGILWRKRYKRKNR